MNVKIDTKEKFHVITVLETGLTANMSAEITARTNEIGQGSIKNVVLNLEGVIAIEPEAARGISLLQQNAYENGHSFVICGLGKEASLVFEEEELLDLLNVTPTESEAWDIVQMEEIEREMLGDD
jgi:anti-anti-sigma regulatory factor